MKRLLLLTVLGTCTLHAEPQIRWQRQQLHGEFYSEGAAIGDLNGDGRNDIVAGPFWWEGPAFEKKHAFYPPKAFSIQGYSDNFFAYVRDFNADQKNDILVLGFPGKEARLYLNPGVHDDQPWPMHIVAEVVDNESPVFTDITGDGKPEIVCSTGGRFGWFAPNWDKPTEKWAFVAVTDDRKVAKFTHGLGVGDVNGDGKNDLLEARHWWENTGDGLWQQHSFAAGIGGGAQMFAYDFDGNGRNDVFTALAAHRYGVAVFLQNRNPQPGAALWQRRLLASEQPQDNDYGIVFSQPHATALADIDGDGVQDLVTGKRYWAHNGKGDPDERGHRVLYWYQTKRDGKGGVDFVPHLVDANSGVGVDVQVGDLNGDALPDIVVGNKGGVYVFTQQRHDISAAEALAAQPRKLYGPALMPQKDYAKGQSPQQALKNLQLPTGFRADLIAAEPDLVQPIAFTFDERGRIWVIEGNSYPKPREVGAGQDRIRILEDRDGDGQYETKKTFCEGLNLASGIELGFGGVWVGAAPYLLFIPDADKDDQPDAEHATYAKTYPKVPGLNFTAYALLDGWGSQDTHETLNSFLWGPDGWLYGCHGVFTHSRVGKPGTPDDQRQPLNAAVWRYHPVRHEFEIFAHGTSNPWGLDYDQHGEFFVTACVIPHLYHIVPGGRYQRQAGQHFNPHTYDDIKTIADHAHYAGNLRPTIEFDKTTGAGLANADTNALGGGHAHCGLAIYQSSHFPATYRNQLIFGNLHGHRLVSNYTDPKASSYIGKHGPDFLRANDMHFIPVTQKVGPDGALYVSDWSDQQICHRGSNAVENWDRSNGRMYRVRYGEGSAGAPARSQASGGEAAQTPEADKSVRAPLFPAAPFDLAQETDEKLARLAVQTENEWFARMARRVLMEKAAAKADMKAALETLTTLGLSAGHSDPRVRAQRANWLLRSRLTAWSIEHAADPGRYGIAFDTDSDSSDEHLAAWGVRFSADPVQANGRNLSAWNPSAPTVTQWPALMKSVYLPLARKTPSPIVRRELASALQRLPLHQRQALASALLQRGEDKDDPMIPLLIWYGIEPLVGADPAAGLQLAAVSKLPKVTGFIYRRLSSDDAGRAAVLAKLAEQPDAVQRESVLALIVAAARSSGKLAMPKDWPALAAKLTASPTGGSGKDRPAKAGTTELVQELSALFGDATALRAYRDRLAEAKTPTVEREHALTVLLQAGDAETAPVLFDLLRQRQAPVALRRQALQALASLKHPQTPAVLSELLPQLPSTEQPDAINTLASTPEGAKALLQAAAAKQVPASALSPFLIRQLMAFKNAEIDALIRSAWGDVNAPKADLGERTKKYRDLLTPAALKKGDLAQGKALFTATCGACHKLFGEGQNVGPDITGSNRGDLNYLLENVLDPNAVIGKAYQLNLFTMKDGRVLSGVIKDESAAVVKIAMMGGVEFSLPQADIAKREVSKLSTMPEGLFDALTPEQVIHLVKYLQSQSPATAETPRVPGALEGENLKAQATRGSVRTQGMGGFKAGRWSGNSHLWWTGGQQGDRLTIRFPVAKAGRQQLFAVFTRAPDYGIVKLTLDGQPVELGELDLYDPQVVQTPEHRLGRFDLSAGEHTLEVSLSGTNANARPAFMFALDYLRLE